MEKSFDLSWESNIYSRGRHLNAYPYDLLVSIVARKYFSIAKDERKKIKVLDLGCGAGNNAKFLAENGFSVYGADGSETVVKACEEKFKLCGLSGEFIAADLINLPYKKNFFDLVVDRESLYANKFSGIKAIIRSVRDKLKKNGLIVSFIYNTYHSDREFGEEIEPNTYEKFRKGNFYATGKAHFADLKEILDLYSEFKIENIMRNSLSEVFDKPHRFMEYDEYIVIAKK